MEIEEKGEKGGKKILKRAGILEGGKKSFGEGEQGGISPSLEAKSLYKESAFN